MRGMRITFVILIVSVALLPFRMAIASAGVTQECVALKETARKFHPGHYVSLPNSKKLHQLGKKLPAGVAGVQIRYLWKDLEPQEGVYDFSQIHADLAAVKQYDAQLVVMIEDKTFNGTIPAPAYLRESTLKNRNRGYTVVRWEPVVVERMNALVHALGEEFDCNPGFEGIAFQESALSLDDSVLSANGYTPEKYAAALETMLLSATASLPHSQVFWYMNFLPGNQGLLAKIADKVAGTGVAMGGPDILPDNYSLAKRTYPFYAEFRDKMILFCSMQNDSYAHPHAAAKAGEKYWTLGELLEFAREELHVSYVFWNLKTWRKPADSYVWADALPVIAAQPVLSQGDQVQTGDGKRKDNSLPES